MKQSKVKNEFRAIVDESAKNKAKTFRFSKTYPAYIVLVLAVSISIFLFFLVKRSIEDTRLNQFDKAATSVMTRLEQGYRINLQVLNSVKGLYDDLPYVVRDHLMLYTRIPLKSNSTILSMMSVQRVSPNYLESYKHDVEGQTYLGYKVFPLNNSKSDYYPVEFVFPENQNRHFHGLDIYSVKELSEVIEESKQTRQLTSTIAFTLRKPDTLSIFLVSPVVKRTGPPDIYGITKDSIYKLMILELDARSFISTSLAKGITSDTSIVFNCYQEKDGNKIEIYKSENFSILPQGFQPGYKDIKKVTIGNKDLYVSFASIPGFGGEFQGYLPLITLIISLIVSLSLFAFVLSVTVTRTRAVALAERLTRSQRRIMESTSDIIASVTFDGEWKSMNPASIKVFGFTPDDMIGRYIKELFVNDKDHQTFLSLKSHSVIEQVHRFDFLMYNANNENKWVNWNFTVSIPDNIIYCVGRDVTLEKQIEVENNIKVKQIELAEQLKTEASEFKSLFLTNLSYRFRNSLTTIMGYQQLLLNGTYEDKEELYNYIDLMYDRTQELLTTITDMVDVAIGSDQGRMKIEKIDIPGILQPSLMLAKENKEGDTIIVELAEKTENIYFFAHKTAMIRVLYLIFKVLSSKMEHCVITANVTPYPYDKMTEIVFQGSPNEFVADMIVQYKEKMTDIINALRFDKEDILLNLSLSTSILRTMGGTMTVETFGGTEGNVVIITLPYMPEEVEE